MIAEGTDGQLIEVYPHEKRKVLLHLLSEKDIITRGTAALTIVARTTETKITMNLKQGAV